jgi:DNA mismatch repair protein MutS2
VQLDPRSRSALEWDALLKRIADGAVSHAGAARVLATEPCATLEAATETASRVSELVRLDALAEGLPVRDFPDVSEPIDRASHGGTLAGTELLGVLDVLRTARALRGFVRERKDTCPALARALGSDAKLERLEEELDRSLDTDGSVSDRASPALADARKSARDARETLKVKLKECLRTYSAVLQGDYFTERDGRYVLPVRADAHMRVDGIVLDASSSGGTLFVEPRETTEQGNKLKLKLAAVEREEQRVLRALSAAVAGAREAIDAALDACIEADRLNALVLFSRSAKAHVLVPEPHQEIELVLARHPLLVGTGIDVIPNSVRVEGGRALVISGPNAGGKTVALKCLGLAAWMVRSGIPVPAEPESRVGWFDDVLSEIGDEQSLEHSLSTFSGHVRRLVEFLERARPGALVLVDEIASGTDPEEGAALAAATLETLTARGAAVAVTTHYERLKELAARGGALGNASVGFDFERMAPTFRLTLGVPGPSSALFVAARFGLPESVERRARELLPESATLREEAVRELEQQKTALEEERARLRGELALAESERAELEARRRELEAEADRELGQEARDLLGTVRMARAEIREARKRLQAGAASAQALRDVERVVSRGAAHVALGGTLDRHREKRVEKPEVERVDFPTGATVRLKKTGSLAVVESVERGQVRLRAGAVRLSVSPQDLELVKRGGGSAPRDKQQKKSPRSFSGSLPAAVRTASNTLDLRGTRADDAGPRVDAFLDRMLGEGDSVGFVLHGHGTGALKAVIREHLGASRYVANCRPAEEDEGGDAFTVFWIAD